MVCGLGRAVVPWPTHAVLCAVCCLQCSAVQCSAVQCSAVSLADGSVQFAFATTIDVDAPQASALELAKGRLAAQLPVATAAALERRLHGMDRISAAATAAATPAGPRKLKFVSAAVPAAGLAGGGGQRRLAARVSLLRREVAAGVAQAADLSSDFELLLQLGSGGGSGGGSKGGGAGKPPRRRARVFNGVEAGAAAAAAGAATLARPTDVDEPASSGSAAAIPAPAAQSAKPRLGAVQVAAPAALDVTSRASFPGEFRPLTGSWQLCRRPADGNAGAPAGPIVRPRHAAPRLPTRRPRGVRFACPARLSTCSPPHPAPPFGPLLCSCCGLGGSRGGLLGRRPRMDLWPLRAACCGPPRRRRHLLDGRRGGGLVRPAGVGGGSERTPLLQTLATLPVAGRQAGSPRALLLHRPTHLPMYKPCLMLAPLLSNEPSPNLANLLYFFVHPFHS